MLGCSGEPGAREGRGRTHPAAGGRGPACAAAAPACLRCGGWFVQKVRVVEKVLKNRKVGVLKLTAVFYLHPNPNVL